MTVNSVRVGCTESKIKLAPTRDTLHPNPGGGVELGSKGSVLCKHRQYKKLHHCVDSFSRLQPSKKPSALASLPPFSGDHEGIQGIGTIKGSGLC